MGGRSVSLACVLAAAAWALAYGLTLAGCIVCFFQLAIGVALVAHGLISSALAVVLTIRTYFVRQTMLLIEAYRLGREQSGDGVRKMRT